MPVEHLLGSSTLLTYPKFWASGANGNTSGLQPEVEGSIPSLSTNFGRLTLMVSVLA